MNPLRQKIIDRIKKEGPITFKTFMEMALYEIGLGYYASEHTEIGKAGDFYTSQHLHPAFGAMIGKQLEEMWEIMGKPSEFYAVEHGAGAGLMCMDIMSYLQKRAIYHSFTYVIVELNPFIQKKQKKLLEKYSTKVKWISLFEEIGYIKGCILSNELLDAFPVHLIEMEDQLKEIYVDVDYENNPPSTPFNEGGQGGFSVGNFKGINFKETKRPLSTKAIVDYIHEFSIQLPKGYRTEINLKIKDWLRSISKFLSEGFVLTIDYGYPASDYYSDERNRGTLLCYYKHQVNEDPYSNIGQQDITAHINFSSIKKWGEKYGFRTIGFCQQGTYLISLGIDEIIKELYENERDYLFEVAKIKRLIFPGTIGETHKVLIQCKWKGNPDLKGFAMKNQMNKL
jgi:SAM-dependent MidA family methyltransferase